MAYYSEQDKKEMNIRQAKIDIGQAIGNSFSKAVDIVLNKYPKLTGDKLLGKIFEIRDKCFASNQEKISLEHKSWQLENIVVEKIEQPSELKQALEKPFPKKEEAGALQTKVEEIMDEIETDEDKKLRREREEQFFNLPPEK